MINEVFLNPPGTSDDGREFIELLGTPGMKLDGYAVVMLTGVQAKFYPLGSIPPIPSPFPEMDEFFSLDGLTLGANGILVLGIQVGSAFWYPTLLADSNHVLWSTLWTGGLDVTGKLGNNGSNTFMLIRNRPGRTEADPSNPAGLRWGKDIAHDAELLTPVLDPVDGLMKDQWGNGDLDIGQISGLGGNTLDIKGASTLADITDDLEIVDEIAYEDMRGWKYDLDFRRVDAGSTAPGLSERGVHDIDDPAGFNPDALSRVDYRTTGIGWPPADAGVGEMGNGNNWQDTATEQWIRGQSTSANVPDEGRIGFFYVNDANIDPEAIQPFETHVPLWLDDAVPPDYDFTTANSYEIMAGRINPLAVPLIPGDTDRDGDADADDIAKIATVFGDDDWIFSNSFSAAPEGDSGDPATQIRPWDVDATGDNGIEASDLQWTLNFQGDATGQIVGIQYDSTTPAAAGVVLNSNAGVACTVTTAVNIPSGRTLATLLVGDLIEVTVAVQVTAGGNLLAGEENGVMQYVHDAVISAPGVVEVASIQPLGSFSTTRAALQALQGVDGDAGVQLVNGFATSFSEGLSGPADLYRLNLEAIGAGSANLTLAPATAAKFAAASPHGLKIGHTDLNGDPSSSIYPAALAFDVTAACSGPGNGDVNGSGMADGADIELFLDVLFNNPTGPVDPPFCASDLNNDAIVDLVDADLFVAELLGPLPLGACCFGDGSCQDGVTVNECTALGGDGFRGVGTDCATTTCPINDKCDNAISLSGATGGEGVFAFDNTGATRDGLFHTTCDGTQIDADIWFCWQAVCSGFVQLDTCGQTAVDTKIAVYDVCDGRLASPPIAACTPSDNSLLACDDNGCSLQSSVLFSAVAGQSYLIRLGTSPGQPGGTGTFTIACLGNALGGDDCADAPAIAGDGTFDFNTLGATTDGLADAGCDFFGQAQIENDVWFCWTASCTGTTTVQTCSATMDTKLAAYDGCTCPTAAPLDCNDDSDACGAGSRQSSVTFPTISGNTYLLRVGSFSAAESVSGALTISCVP